MRTPEPEVTSTQTYAAGWDQWPTGPRSLATYAQAHGWEVRIGWSRGSWPAQKQGTFKTVDLIGVWVDGHQCRGVAWWVRHPHSDAASAQSWTVDSTAIWVQPGAAFPYANLTEFKVWLKDKGAPSPAFYRAARDRVRAAEAKAKQSKPSVKAKENAG